VARRRPTLESSSPTADAGLELEGLRGQQFRPGEDGYDDARAVYNGMIDRRPALIARCSGVADVVDAVNLARERRLPLAVRCGGHSVAGKGSATTAS
jgi:FAD binding domain